MAISNSIRDQLLVESQHRCTVCAETCFEIHHIVEQAEDGDDNPDNLIVLCSNCNRDRHHRAEELTREQLGRYKAKLREQNEVNRRLLLNLEEIRIEIGKIPIEESERKAQQALQEALSLVSQEKWPTIYTNIIATSRWLAERDLIRGGARKAIEIEWEIRWQREVERCARVSIVRIDQGTWEEATDVESAYTLALMLDHAPSYDWYEIFEFYRKGSPYHIKQKTRIKGEKMIVASADSGEIQHYIECANRLVQQTNHYFEESLPQLYEAMTREKQMALDSFDAIQSPNAHTQDTKS